MITIETIRACLLEDRFQYSRHALTEMKDEELGRIFDADIESAIMLGEVIRQYPEDRPYPSVLIAGNSDSNPIHVVCAFNSEDQTTLVVTAYRPDSRFWIDLKTRRN